MSITSKSVSEALADVRADIARYELKHQREPGSVKLLAVSKRKPLDAIVQAISAGQTAFGENYVDEGIEKIQALGSLKSIERPNEPDLEPDNEPDNEPEVKSEIESGTGSGVGTETGSGYSPGTESGEVEWHYIGAIQSRKAALIARHFQWAHGVDRIKVARRLSEHRPDDQPALKVCLQIKLDDEPDKAGVLSSEAYDLAAQCMELPGIDLCGLMAIPMPRPGFDEQRQSLARLRHCRDRLAADFPGISILSMGMSADLEAAIAEGATMVRIGTAIFGRRDR